MSNAGSESHEVGSSAESPPDTISPSNPTDPPAMVMTLPSSGSSEEDVTQYADNSVSQTETRQDKSSSEVLTADKAITNVLQTEVSDPQLTISVDEPPAPSNTAVLRNLFGDSESEISLGERTKLTSPRPLFSETQDNPVAASRESCFAVLHEPRQLRRGQVVDYYAESTDGDQAGTSRNCNTVLNSLDPFPTHVGSVGLAGRF